MLRDSGSGCEVAAESRFPSVLTSAPAVETNPPIRPRGDVSPRLLRGEPSRHSLAEMREALAAGARPSEAFLARLERDPRAGAPALARAFRNEARDREWCENMLALERALWQDGHGLVAGVDEAGMGPLAGPIVAAAVILSPQGPIPLAEDSKILDAPTRERLADEIHRTAVAVAIGVSTVEEIADTDVYQAGLQAMRRAVLALQPQPLALLVDARVVPDVTCLQQAHVKGDARSRSIASASIIAKVTRDAEMARLAVEFPGYGFEKHAGYGTPEHLEALRRLGACAAHRRSWAALAEHSGEMSASFYALRDALKDSRDDASLMAWRQRAHAEAASLPASEIKRLDALARRRFKQVGGGEHASLPLTS